MLKPDGQALGTLNRQEQSEAIISIADTDRGGVTQRQSLPPQMIEKISLKMGGAAEYVSYVNHHPVRESNNLDLPITLKNSSSIPE